jgi:outer membrane protein
MNLKLSILGIVLLGISMSLKGKPFQQDDTLRLGLKDAQDYALEFNREVKSAKKDVELARQKVWETTTIGLPNVSLSVDYQHNFTVPVMNFGPYLDFSGLDPNNPVLGSDLLGSYRQSPDLQLGVKNNTSINLTVTQLIFSGEYIVGLQASRVFKELSEKSLVASELKTREIVSTSYYLVLVIDENLSILRESVSLLKKTLDEVTKLYEQGFTDDTDVDQMRLNLSMLETSVTSLEGQRKIADQLLKLQMGVELDKPLKLMESITNIIAGSGQAEIPQFELEKSINYQLLETQEGLMSLSLKREKWKFLPSIAAFYRHQELTNQPEFNFSPKDVLGVTASLPIFTSGQRLSKVKQAKLELEKTQLQKEQAGASLILEYNSALNTHQTALKNYSTNKSSMELSQRIYNKTIVKFKEGIVSSLDLTQSQNQYLTAQGKYYNSVVELLNAKAALDRILATKN